MSHEGSERGMTQRQSRCVLFSNNVLVSGGQRTNHRPICDFSQNLRSEFVQNNFRVIRSSIQNSAFACARAYTTHPRHAPH